MKLDQVALAGHSMGGTISLIHAMAHPERIRKLAVVNPLVVGATAFNSRTKTCMLPGVRALLFWGSRIGPIRRRVSKDFSYGAKYDEELSLDLIRGSYQATFDSLISDSKTDFGSKLSTLAVDTLASGIHQDQLMGPGQY